MHRDTVPLVGSGALSYCLPARWTLGLRLSLLPDTHVEGENQPGRKFKESKQKILDYERTFPMLDPPLQKIKLVDACSMGDNAVLVNPVGGPFSFRH